MRDFIGRYQLVGGLPPENWKKQVERLAETAQLEVRSMSLEGVFLKIRCRVPEGTPDPRAMAQAFFEQAGAALSGSTDSGTVVSLEKVEPVRSRPFIDVRRLRKAAWSTLKVAVVAATLIAGLVALTEFLQQTFGRAGLIWLAVLFLFLVMGFFGPVFYDTADIDEPKTSSGFRVLDGEEHVAAARLHARVKVEAEHRAAAADEDPKQRRRIEDAKRALRLGAGRMRTDADQLWRRSVRVGRTAVGVLILALGGPAVSAILLFLRGASAEWYLMFGGIGLAAVPLLLGGAMLRHEAKLREQYREVSREVANLERLDLALEYARIESEPDTTHSKALEQVVTQLLSLPPASAAPVPAAPGGQSDEKETGADSTAIVKVLEATLGALTKRSG